MEVKDIEKKIIDENNLNNKEDKKEDVKKDIKEDIKNIKIEEKEEIKVEKIEVIKQEEKKEISNVELLEKINKLEEDVKKEKKQHEEYVLSSIKNIDRDYLDFLVSKEKDGSIEEKIEKIKLSKPELFKEEENRNIQNLNIINSKNKGDLKSQEIFRADFNKKSLTERMKLIKNGVKII